MELAALVVGEYTDGTRVVGFLVPEAILWNWSNGLSHSCTTETIVSLGHNSLESLIGRCCRVVKYPLPVGQLAVRNCLVNTLSQEFSGTGLARVNHVLDQLGVQKEALQPRVIKAEGSDRTEELKALGSTLSHMFQADVVDWPKVVEKFNSATGLIGADGLTAPTHSSRSVVSLGSGAVIDMRSVVVDGNGSHVAELTDSEIRETIRSLDVAIRYDSRLRPLLPHLTNELDKRHSNRRKAAKVVRG